MNELTGKIEEFNIDFVTGKAVLNLAINEKQSAVNCYEELKDVEKLSIKISKYRKKRSLDSNSYFWVLCGKLASKLQQDKITVYRQLIKNIGDNYEIIPIRNDAKDTFVRNWENRGLGWICETLGDSKIKGYTNLCVYYGSSTYNSKQMSDLINNIVFECKEQGINTMTTEEIDRMLALWGERV